MTNSAVTIFFDVNETLSDLAPVADAFDHVGAGRGLAATWFSTILRDGFALTAVGSPAHFLDIAATNARGVLRSRQLNRSLDESVDAVLTAFASVHLHDDVAPGIRSLNAAGHRLFTLSNGPTSTAERLFAEAGITKSFEGVLSVEGHSAWKPARDAYDDALARTGTGTPAYLVAVHPWDIHGASAAGLSTVWVNRSGATYPEHSHTPTMTVHTIGELSGRLES